MEKVVAFLAGVLEKLAAGLLLAAFIAGDVSLNARFAYVFAGVNAAGAGAALLLIVARRPYDRDD